MYAKWVEEDGRFGFALNDNGGVEITRATHAELLAGQSAGKIIIPDANGSPVLADPPKATVGQMWDKIKEERNRRTETGGFQCAGKWYHSDIHSKAQHLGNKDTARDQLVSGGAMTDPLLDPITGLQILWKTMDGSWQPLTCQLAFDIVKAGKGSEFAHYTVAEIHHAAMRASSDPASYDFSSGWPAIYEE